MLLMIKQSVNFVNHSGLSNSDFTGTENDENDQSLPPE